jgi:hypothetical protein
MSLYNLPATGLNRWDQGLTAAEMKRCRWVKPVMVCRVKFIEWTRDDRLRYVSKIGSKIVLIDGSRLAELMIEFGVAVATESSYTVKRIDKVSEPLTA